jgi:HSP20 family protein
MSITRWDPWGDIVSLREAMNNLLEESFVRPHPGISGPGMASSLALDVKENPERRFGAFERTVSLPSTVDAEGAAADFENGVLTITLPKADIAKPRSIPVRGSGAGETASREPQPTEVEIHGESSPPRQDTE